jgi:hypothetical protein
MLSPRRAVRVAAWDAAVGQWANRYDETVAIADLGRVDRSRPVAMHLAPFQVPGHREGFRHMVFDLDAKAVADPAMAEADARLLAGAAHLLGTGTVITCSGPSGGRHVWATCEELIPLALVERIMRAAARCAPSLDTTPMTNPRTGSLRPPGSPHRVGGHAHLLDGMDVEQAVVALSAGAPLHAFVDLAELLEARAALLPPVPQPTTKPHRTVREAVPSRAGEQAAPGVPPSIAALGEPVRRLVTDADGHPRLAVATRTPSERTRQALQRTLGGEVDHSAHAHAVLVGLLLAGWGHAQIALVAGDPSASPGLEWLRTTRAAGHLRVAHSAAECDRRLDRAVFLAAHTAARLPRQHPEDEHDLLDGVEEVTTTVTGLLQRIERAGADGDRWTRPSGPADRAALFAIAYLALLAGSLTLDLDVRRLALLIGYSHQTAAVALRRLFADGWLAEISPAAPAARRARTLAIIPDGTHCCSAHPGHRCAIADLDDPSPLPPAHAGPDTINNTAPPRGPLLDELGSTLQTLSLDIWSLPEVGHHAAWTLLAVRPDIRKIPDLAIRTGYTDCTVRRHCRALVALGLLESDEHGQTWRRSDHAAGRLAQRARGTRAEARGVTRAVLYRVERAVADWWQAEREWLSSDWPTRRRRGRRAHPDQLVLPHAAATSRAYPRHGDRPDHHRAWNIEARRLELAATIAAAELAQLDGYDVDLLHLTATGTLRTLEPVTGSEILTTSRRTG